MSYTDGLAGLLANNPQTQQQTAALAFQNIQNQRVLGALANVNLNDPSSTNSAMQSLTRVGALEQAAALSNLGRTRVQNQLAQTAIAQAQQGLSGQAPPSPDASQFDVQRHQQLLSEANAALNDIMSTEDPDQRQQKAQQWKTHFQQEGVPEDAIDGVISDLSDVGLKAHQANIQRELGQYDVTHAPGYQAAAGALNSGLANPIVMGALASGPAGIDVSPGLNLAANITSPLRSTQVQAAYAPQIAGATTAATNVANLATLPAVEAATTSARNIANLNTLPAVQRAVAEASARGAAAGSPMEISLPDGSTQKGIVNYDPAGKPYFVPIGSAPPQTGGAAGAPLTAPSLAAGAGLMGGAEANTQQATAFEQYAGGYPTRKANLENLRQAATQVATGPNANFWRGLGALAAEYGVQTPITPTQNQTAAYEEVNKIAQMVLSQQRETMGLPNTNQSVNMAVGATPHEETSPQGLQRLAGILEGNEDYINAERQAWQTWKGNGRGYETWQQFVPQWNAIFDPRVFQAQYMDAEQKALTRSAVGAARFDKEEAAAKRLGYLAAQ